MVPTRPPPLQTVESPTRTNGLTRRRGARSGHRSRSTSRHRSPSDDSERDPVHKPDAPGALEAELKASYGSSAAVDRGLGGVASSLRSSWSMSSAIMPPMPNGEAVPTLLSHLAGAFGLCFGGWKITARPVWLCRVSLAHSGRCYHVYSTYKAYMSAPPH